MIANNTLHGLPTVSGFTETYWMAIASLLLSGLTGLLIPVAPAPTPAPVGEPELAGAAAGR